MSCLEPERVLEQYYKLAKDYNKLLYRVIDLEKEILYYKNLLYPGPKA